MRIDYLKAGLCGLLLLSGAVFAEESESRKVRSFRGIAIGGGINLQVNHGDHYQVIVRSDSGDPDEVETEVSGDTLTIRHTEHWFWVFKMINQFDDSRYTVEVTVPELNKVTAGGGSRVKFDDGFTADHLKLVASGGSRIRFNGKIDTLDLRTSGGASANLAGSVDSFNVVATGGSHTEAQKFVANKADIATSGGSGVVLDVRDKLTVRASGGSSVRYSGDPRHKDINASKSARVRSINEKMLSAE